MSSKHSCLLKIFLNCSDHQLQLVMAPLGLP